MIGPRRFRFLNETHELIRAADWNHPEREKLWLYNLHYFADLNAQDAAQRRDWHRELIRRWIADNPPAMGNGWEPYPLSLRIVNWIKWFLAGNTPEPDWLHSLAVQTRRLAQRLEWHLLGNHLFANAKALVFAGQYFSGPEAEGWLNTGLAILGREVPEQVLADGGHFELSPMYHGIILEDLLDLINLNRSYGGLAGAQGREWETCVRPMGSWLAAMTHPDGGIALFNDAAHGIACSPADLDAYARRLGLGRVHGIGDGITHLADSGYLRWQRGPAVGVLDIGRIGPDYLPGHAHADTLAFELSLHGRRVLVNTGTSCYGNSPERLRQRGTAAHNTVVVDGQDSSEVWGGFRVARRARPLDLKVERSDGQTQVTCAHDGYRRLPGRPIHRRRWQMGEGRLTVADRLEGRPSVAVARYHFHPDLYPDSPAPDRGVVRLANGRTLGWTVSQGQGRLVDSAYHPRFGISIPNRCLEVHFAGAEASVDFHWD